MIKQWVHKRLKIAYGFLNTYVLKKGRDYDDANWWDKSFYIEGVSDRQTISREKSVIIAKYHYASMETLILKHLAKNYKSLEQASVLDLGSGSGHWIDFFASLGAQKLTGMDVSITSFHYLDQKYSDEDRIDIRQGKALDVLKNLDGQYDIVNAIGVMFHIVDDYDWQETITAVGDILKNDGLFIVGGHFGLVNGLNVQIDKNGDINKRLRSKRFWRRALIKSGFRHTKIYRNNAYLQIKESLPENNVLVASK